MIPPSASLERRLLGGIGISVLVVFTLLLVGGSLAIRQFGEDYIQSRLTHDMEALLGALETSPGGGLRLPEGRLSAVYRQPFSGHYFQVRADSGISMRSRSLWDEVLEHPTLEAGDRRSRRIPGPSDQSLLAIAGGFNKFDRRLTLLLAEDITPLERRIGQYRWGLGGAFLLVVFALLLLQRWVVRRELGRLDSVKKDLQAIEQGTREDVREAVPLEVLPLVQEVNRLLQLLAQRLERSRNALGNLAHALKAPLTVLQSTLARQQLGAAEQSLAMDQVQRIRERIEQELRRARIAGGSLPGRQFDPSQELPPLVDTLTRMYQAKALEIDVIESPDHPLPLDREDMLELLGNLMDNACKWARSQVQLSMAVQTGMQFTVEDDGPGVDPEAIGSLTKRGKRVDESREGHGLGLAIVRDIVEVYGGTLHFDRSARLNGLRVRVRLPTRKGH